MALLRLRSAITTSKPFFNSVFAVSSVTQSLSSAFNVTSFSRYTSTAAAATSYESTSSSQSSNEQSSQSTASLIPKNLIALKEIIEQGHAQLKEVPVYSLTGDATSTIDLDPAVFGQPMRQDILTRCVNYHRSKRRKGTFKAKDRSEVAGSGKKMRPQKKSGRARCGDKRPPHWRHGGVAHGPRVRSFEIGLQRKVRQLGLKVALSARFFENRLIVLENDSLSSPKTKNILPLFKKLGIDDFIFIGDLQINSNFELAARNLPRAEIMNHYAATTYDILRHKYVVTTVDAVKNLTTRLTSRVVPPFAHRTLAKRALEQERLAKHQAVLSKLQAEGVHHVPHPLVYVESIHGSLSSQTSATAAL